MCGKYSKNECVIKKFGPNYILYNEYEYIYYLCDVFFNKYKYVYIFGLHLLNKFNEFRLIKKKGKTNQNTNRCQSTTTYAVVCFETFLLT